MPIPGSTARTERKTGPGFVPGAGRNYFQRRPDPTTYWP